MKDQRTNELLQTLMKCLAACEHCATACLGEEDVAHMEQCIRNDRDCADVCALTARLVARESHHVDRVLQLCIVICKACEQECRRHMHEHCQQCAEACSACHIACEVYSHPVNA